MKYFDITNLKFILNLILLSSFYPVFGQEVHRESILGKKEYIQDSISYHIDSLPPFCKTLDMKSQYIDIGDCKLYCETEGEGIPMVLINGGPGGTHHCFHPWFSQASSFSQVIYYDQRGCGQSDYIQGDGYTFRQAVDDLDRLRQKLNIDKWIVCGYSYGGALAQYYSISYPEHTAGMVLIGATPLIGSDLPQGSRQEMFITKQERKRINEIYNLYRKGEINDFQLMYNKEINGDWKRQNFYKPSDEEIIRSSLYEWMHDDTFRQKVGWGYKQYNFKEILVDCPIPTLMCEGKWDLTWTEEKRDVFRQSQPLAQFVLFENAGHTIFSEEPEVFFAKLKDFAQNLNDVPDIKIQNWKKRIYPIINPQEELFYRENKFVRLIETKGLAEGISFYNKYTKEHPGEKLFTESGMNNLGYSFWRKNDNTSAAQVFLINLKEYPQSALILENLGDTYVRTKDKVKAREYYLRSLEIDPNNNRAKKALEKLTDKQVLKNCEKGINMEAKPLWRADNRRTV